jgi:hypothetical protein
VFGELRNGKFTGLINDLGITPENLKSQKFSSDFQERLQAALFQRQQASLRQNGLELTPANLYGSHSIGAGGHAQVMQAAKTQPNTPVVEILANNAATARNLQPGSRAYNEFVKKHSEFLTKRNPHLLTPAGQWYNRMVQIVDNKTAVRETRMTNKKDVADRYSFDEFDDLVRRLGQRAKEQERRYGPVDIKQLAKRLRDIADKDDKPIKEEDPATDPTRQSTSPTLQATSANQQDTNPNQQITSQTGTSQERKEKQAQAQDTATAKTMASSLTTVVPPGTNTNALAQAIVNTNDGKPLSADQQKAISVLQPLVLKAAETPTTASALGSALQKAGMLSKQGK